MQRFPFFLLLSTVMLVAWGALAPRGAAVAHSVEGIDVDTAAAAPDTSVDVIAYFCKRDTTCYTYEHSRIKIKGGDTTVMSSVQEEFYVTVLDSTAQGYRMEFCPTSIVFPDATAGDSIDFSSMLTLLAKNMVGRKIVFTLSPEGKLEHIKNWKALRRELKDGFKHMIDSVFNRLPQLDTVFDRASVYDLVTAQYDSEEDVINSLSELSLLFSCHGLSFPLTADSTFVIDDDPDATMPQQVALNTGILGADDVDPFDEMGEYDYYIDLRTHTDLPPSMISLVLKSTMALLGDSEKGSAEVTKGFDDAVKGMKDLKCNGDGRSVISYSVNGWPKHIVETKQVEVTGTQDGKSLRESRIDLKSIDWSSRSWFNF